MRRFVSPLFYAYWLGHGALAKRGLPSSDEFEEWSEADGKKYSVQYFERARFEYHPEKQAPFNVLLGLLGAEQYKARYGGGTSAPSPSASPSPSPGPAILFQDNFSDSNSGWPVTDVKDVGSTSYANGGYRVGMAAANLRFFPTNRKVGDLGDIAIAVGAVKVGGPADALFGVQCRAQDIDNVYFVDIDATGHSAIIRVQNGTPTPIATTSAGTSPAIKTGNATNHLRAECAGKNRALIVNGQRVLEAQDATFATGRIGFGGITFGQGGLDVTFRALVITASAGASAASTALSPATSDEALMVAAAHLVEGAGGGAVVRNLVEHETSWVFAPLDRAYGVFDPRINRMSVTRICGAR